MGTKRHMARGVHDAIRLVSGDGPVLDLFGGTGTVAETFANELPVGVNDAAEFIAAMLRARFTAQASFNSSPNVDLESAYLEALTELTTELQDQLAAESAALDSGRDALSRYMARAKHVANSAEARRRAKLASTSRGIPRYRLANLYFSAGFFSLRQAIEIDAMRYAIDLLSSPETRDTLLSKWLIAASAILNAPGHTAQFLKPGNSSGYSRVVRAWRMGFADEFERLGGTELTAGTASWRSSNRVYNKDALALLRSGDADAYSAIYADPPYTRDQYGRFYHVYETLFRYDYPTASGLGRVRGDAFHTGFSQKTRVEWSMRELFRLSATTRTPIVVSYPSNGLLTQAGCSLRAIAAEYFEQVEVLESSATHSTLGGSPGSGTKAASEQLVVCA